MRTALAPATKGDRRCTWSFRGTGDATPACHPAEMMDPMFLRTTQWRRCGVRWHAKVFRRPLVHAPLPRAVRAQRERHPVT